MEAAAAAPGLDPGVPGERSPGAGRRPCSLQPLLGSRGCRGASRLCLDERLGGAASIWALGLPCLPPSRPQLCSLLLSFCSDCQSGFALQLTPMKCCPPPPTVRSALLSLVELSGPRRMGRGASSVRPCMHGLYYLTLVPCQFASLLFERIKVLRIYQHHPHPITLTFFFFKLDSGLPSRSEHMVRLWSTVLS